MVVVHILALIAAFPEHLENAPERMRTHAYWSKLLDPASAQGAHALAVLSEVPAFLLPQAEASKTRVG